MASRVTGWKLPAAERARLLDRFMPRFDDVVADHVTLDAKAGRDTPLPRETAGEVIGEVDDGAGVQALVVRIGGTTDRPGGGAYHITWSIDRASGRRAEESNEVIARLGWRPLPEPVPVRLRPARF